MAYRLYTTHYRDKNPVRRLDYELCLAVNVTAFDVVTVVSEDVLEPVLPCEWYILDRRPTFRDVADLAANAEPDDIVVITNSDIFFTRCELEKMNSLVRVEAYSLSRWDVLKGGIRLFDHRYTQDAWVFRGPPRFKGGDFVFGQPGSDNRITHELDASGYKVYNPSRSIKAYHVHMPEQRNLNLPELRVPLPYLFVEPAKLGERPKYFRPKKLSKNAGHHQ